MPENSLPLFLTVWLAASAALVLGRWWRKTESTGLVLAYVLNLWMIHWVAPAFYLAPWFRNLDVSLVVAGLEQSMYGILAFAFGSLIVTPVVMQFGLIPRTIPRPSIDAELPRAYLWLGVGSYVLLSLGVGFIPSATALVSTGQQLVVVGLCLGCWYSWQTHNLRTFMAWLAFALAMPFITIISRGFIGYGVVAALNVLIFVSGFIRPRWKIIGAA